MANRNNFYFYPKIYFLYFLALELEKEETNLLKNSEERESDWFDLFSTMKLVVFLCQIISLNERSSIVVNYIYELIKCFRLFVWFLSCAFGKNGLTMNFHFQFKSL